MARWISTLALVAAFLLPSLAHAAPPAGQTSYPAAKVWDATKDDDLQQILNEGRAIPSMTATAALALPCNSMTRGSRVWVTDALLTINPVLAGGANALTVVCNGSSWVTEMSQSPATDLVCTTCVGTSDIADDSISSSKIPNNAVGTTEIQDASVTNAKIQDGAVTTDELATGAVASVDILDGTIAAGDLASDAVTTTKILDSAVTSAKIADGSIVEADLQNGSVTKDKIAADAVGTSEIVDGSILTADYNTASVDANAIASDAVGSAEIATGAVTTTEILDATIAAGDIATGAVTTTGILDGTITTTDISASAGITDAQVSDTITVGASGSVNVSALPSAVVLESEIVPRTEGAADPTSGTDCTTIGQVYVNTTTGTQFTCLDDSPNVWATSAARTAASVAIESPSTGDDATAVSFVPVTSLLTGVYCVTDAGTVTMQLERRVRTTLGIAGTSLLTGSVTCDSDGATGTLIASPTATTSDALVWRISAVSGAGFVRAYASSN